MKSYVLLLVIFIVGCSHNTSLIPFNTHNKSDWEYQLSDTLIIDSNYNHNALTYTSPAIEVSAGGKHNIVDSTKLEFITGEILSNHLVMQFNISSFQSFNVYNNSDIKIFPEYYLKLFTIDNKLLTVIKLDASSVNTKYYKLNIKNINQKKILIVFIRYTYIKYPKIKTVIDPITIENFKIWNEF